jgi:NAD(P)H-dependent flavin oxidoreductase YrpB (nitropropane dioxygenase family)
MYRLDTGDPNGHMRRALATFPDQDMVDRIMDKYFIEGGKEEHASFRSLPMWTMAPSQHLLEATVLANYCEVWLAKHNDDSTPIDGGGHVGINRLTKVTFPTIASLYGAMLADVDYVIMGAGIPLRIPGVLDDLSQGKDTSYPVDVAGSEESHEIAFSPKAFWTAAHKPELTDLVLKRPAFVPIVSSVVLAQSMLKRANGKGPTKGIDGFVVELPTAGGHNAPPRGFRYDPVAKSHAMDLNDKGEPIYGPKDEVDLLKFLKASQNLPFWLAGSYGNAEKFAEIVAMGGAGIQVGTGFALSKESGMDQAMKQKILQTLQKKDLHVFTDPVASPTGYPFKVLELENTLSTEECYSARPRLCSLGYLRTAYIDDTTGKIGYRCPAEPVDDWLKKGGEVEATIGRKCLCNALTANAGFPQTRMYKDRETGEKKEYVEDMLITIGDEVNFCRKLIQQDEITGQLTYSAGDVVDYLNSAWHETEAREDLGETVFEKETVKAVAAHEQQKV